MAQHILVENTIDIYAPASKPFDEAVKTTQVKYQCAQIAGVDATDKKERLLGSIVTLRLANSDVIDLKLNMTFCHLITAQATASEFLCKATSFKSVSHTAIISNVIVILDFQDKISPIGLRQRELLVQQCVGLIWIVFERRRAK
jgi:hypothetical protein